MKAVAVAPRILILAWLIACGSQHARAAAPGPPVALVSRNGRYRVSYRGLTNPQEAAKYVNRVEALIPALQRTLGLPSSYRSYLVEFGQEPPSTYHGDGRITIAKGLKLEEHVYGGLFHETAHGFLAPYGSSRGNWIPEYCAIILQAEALRNVPGDKKAAEWVKAIAGQGGDDADCKRFWAVYERFGFEPFRRVYVEMARQKKPIIKNAAGWYAAWAMMGVPLAELEKPQPVKDDRKGAKSPRAKRR